MRHPVDLFTWYEILRQGLQPLDLGGSGTVRLREDQSVNAGEQDRSHLCQPLVVHRAENQRQRFLNELVQIVAQHAGGAVVVRAIE